MGLVYRKLKMNNKKVQDTVVNVDGGLELLQACGFELVFEDGTPESQSQTSPSSQSPDTAPSTQTASQTDTSNGTQANPSGSQTDTGTTGYLWFPEEAELWLLEAALQLLRPLVPLPFTKSAARPASQPSTSGAGCIKVLHVDEAIKQMKSAIRKGAPQVPHKCNNTRVGYEHCLSTRKGYCSCNICCVLAANISLWHHCTSQATT